MMTVTLDPSLPVATLTWALASAGLTLYRNKWTGTVTLMTAEKAAQLSAIERLAANRERVS